MASVSSRGSSSLLHDASALVPLVTFPERAKRVLLRLLRVLREDHGGPQSVGGEAHLLLTDRTFLVKVLPRLRFVLRRFVLAVAHHPLRP